MSRSLRAELVSVLVTALAATSAAGQDAPTASELGILCFPDGSEKNIDPDDALWAARMIHGETGGSATAEDAKAMLWSMAQRSYWSPSWRPKSLGDLIRAYSQPINPRWTRTGKYCKKYYAEDYEGEVPDNCSESRLKRRDQYRGIAWSAIDATARDAVVQFGAGTLDNPVPGAVGWFAKGLWKKREQSGKNAEEHMVFQSEIEKNVYFYADGPGAALDTRSWTASEVVVAGPGNACPERN
jgi:hypothetical protein